MPDEPTGPKVGPDMPADEFAALLDRQPPLEARWQPAGFGRDWPTPEWHELSDGEQARLALGWKARAEGAEALIGDVREFVRVRELRALDGGRTWAPGLRKLLGMLT